MHQDALGGRTPRRDDWVATPPRSELLFPRLQTYTSMGRGIHFSLCRRKLSLPPHKVKLLPRELHVFKLQPFHCPGPVEATWKLSLAAAQGHPFEAIYFNSKAHQHGFHSAEFMLGSAGLAGYTRYLLGRGRFGRRGRRNRDQLSRARPACQDNRRCRRSLLRGKFRFLQWNRMPFLPHRQIFY